MKKIVLISLAVVAALVGKAQQNVGIGTNDPKSKLDVKGGVAIGTNYSGVIAAPANGAIIEGPVGIGTSTPDAKAALDVNSTTQGMLVPRMNTTQRNAISSPSNGLLIYNTSTNQFNYFNGSTWETVGGIGTPTGAAGGDLTGTYPNPSIAANAVNSGKIQDASITGADIANNTIDLTSKVNNVLPVANGGIGVNTVSGIMQGNGSSAVTGIGASAGSQYLRRNAANTAYEFGQIAYSTISGTPTSLPPSGAAGGDLTGTYPSPTLATVGTAGTYNYITTDAKGRVTSGALRTVTGSSNQIDVANGNFAANPTISINESYTASLKASHILTGGGNVSYAGGTLNWTSRFIVLANGRGSQFSTIGYFDITLPSNGTVITGVGGAANVTVASGIPIGTWTALYYILPIGSSSTSLPANFRVASYTANMIVPENWVLVAIRNNDNNTIRLGNGLILEDGQTWPSNSGMAPLTGGTGYINNQAVNSAFGTGQSASFDITGSAQIGSNGTVGGNLGVGTATVNHRLVVNGNSVSRGVALAQAFAAQNMQFRVAKGGPGFTTDVTTGGPDNQYHRLTLDDYYALINISAYANERLDGGMKGNGILLTDILTTTQTWRTSGGTATTAGSTAGVGTNGVGDNVEHTCQCANNEIVTGVEVYSGSYWEGRLKVRCAQLAAGFTTTNTGIGIESAVTVPFTTGADDTWHHAACPPNTFMKGLSIRASDQLDGEITCYCTGITAN